MELFLRFVMATKMAIAKTESPLEATGLIVFGLSKISKNSAALKSSMNVGYYLLYFGTIRGEAEFSIPFLFIYFYMFVKFLDHLPLHAQGSRWFTTLKLPV